MKCQNIINKTIRLLISKKKKKISNKLRNEFFKNYLLHCTIFLIWPKNSQ